MTVIHTSEVEPVHRGGGITTVPLVSQDLASTARITTGISTFPPGAEAALHKHGCDEQVTLLEGSAEVILDESAIKLAPYDTTYIAAGSWHAFRNVGQEPMKILWIYPDTSVTRTLHSTGRTVEHLSPEDRMA